MNNRERQIFYERLAVNDFSTAQLASYRAKLTQEEQQRLVDVRNRNTEFLKNHPFSQVRSVFSPYLGQKQSLKTGWWKHFFTLPKLAYPVFACLTALLVFSLIFLNNSGLRMKGSQEAALLIYKQVTADQAVLLEDSAPVQAGDRLQVAYRAGSDKYGAIVSIDGNGDITYHFPRLPGQAAELSPGGEEILLPYSCKLDSAPRYELFLLLSSNRNFTLNEVETALLKINNIVESDLAQLKAWHVQKVLLIKEEL